MPTEADTCRTHITPALQTAGWESEPHSIAEQRTFTDGRIIVRGNHATRRPAKRADYILRYTRDFPIAVVETKAEDKPAADGIGELERVDIILTNPPFGGEEEPGIQGNFPDYKRTAETALLFLQLIMRKLRRQSGKARAAVVVPNGALFGDGVCARIKEELLTDFNLHTIVRLPNGVFAPYTGSPPMCCSLTAQALQRRFGITSSPCPKAAKITPRPSLSSLRNLPPVSHGGANAREMNALGRFRLPNFWQTAATLTARTRVARRITPICHRRKSSPRFWKRSGVFPKSWGISRACLKMGFAE